MHCHPDWMSPAKYKRYIKHLHKRLRLGLPVRAELGAWRNKVVLKEAWIERCLDAGRFLVGLLIICSQVVQKGLVEQWAADALGPGCRSGLGRVPGRRVSHCLASPDDID